MAATHGGAFWRTVGDDLSRLSTVVRADVLDAWFPPAPSVTQALCQYDVEMCRTSPEAEAGPLRLSIADARSIPEDCILTGAGSSALIYLALPILTAEAKSALVLDPMYGEYRSVLRELCGLHVHTLSLSRSNSYKLRAEDLLDCGGDLVALVNPNSPTGQHVPRAELAPVVEELARTRLVWIDETYNEYAGEAESLEGLACTNPNIVVCKSMSKVYALSGLRIGYLVSHPARIAVLSKHRPPWAVSLPAQVCASIALGEPGYYASQYEETASLRRELRRQLAELGLDVLEGCINSLLVHPPDGSNAADACAMAAEAGVFLRDPSSMWASDPPQAIRISVRNRAENDRIVRCFEHLGTAPVPMAGQSFCNSTPCAPWT